MVVSRRYKPSLEQTEDNHSRICEFIGHLKKNIEKAPITLYRVPPKKEKKKTFDWGREDTSSMGRRGGGSVLDEIVYPWDTHDASEGKYMGSDDVNESPAKRYEAHSKKMEHINTRSSYDLQKLLENAAASAASTKTASQRKRIAEELRLNRKKDRPQMDRPWLLASSVSMALGPGTYDPLPTDAMATNVSSGLSPVFVSPLTTANLSAMGSDQRSLRPRYLACVRSDQAASIDLPSVTTPATGPLAGVAAGTGLKGKPVTTRRTLVAVEEIGNRTGGGNGGAAQGGGTRRGKAESGTAGKSNGDSPKPDPSLKAADAPLASEAQSATGELQPDLHSPAFSAPSLHGASPLPSPTEHLRGTRFGFAFFSPGSPTGGVGARSNVNYVARRLGENLLLSPGVRSTTGRLETTAGPQLGGAPSEYIPSPLSHSSSSIPPDDVTSPSRTAGRRELRRQQRRRNRYRPKDRRRGARSNYHHTPGAGNSHDRPKTLFSGDAGQTSEQAAETASSLPRWGSVQVGLDAKDCAECASCKQCRQESFGALPICPHGLPSVSRTPLAASFDARPRFDTAIAAQAARQRPELAGAGNLPYLGSTYRPEWDNAAWARSKVQLSSTERFVEVKRQSLDTMYDLDTLHKSSLSSTMRKSGRDYASAFRSQLPRFQSSVSPSAEQSPRRKKPQQQQQQQQPASRHSSRPTTVITASDSHSYMDRKFTSTQGRMVSALQNPDVIASPTLVAAAHRAAENLECPLPPNFSLR